MGWIVLLILVVCFFSFPTLRCAVLHPVALVRYGVKDLIQYIKYERWNECKTGELVAYVGNLQKSFKAGDMLSEDEILALRRNEQQANMDGVVKPSRRWRRNQKKLRK